MLAATALALVAAREQDGDGELALGDTLRLCRASRAAHARLQATPEAWLRLGRRAGWARPVRDREQLLQAMHRAPRRCRECGLANGRGCLTLHGRGRASVCLRCQADRAGYSCLVDRAWVRSCVFFARALSKRGRVRPTYSGLLRHLFPVRRARAGFGTKLLYWRVHVERQLGGGDGAHEVVS